VRGDPPALDDEQVRHLAALAGLEIAPEHLPGVIRNLQVLREQAALLFQQPLDPSIEPLPVFSPRGTAR
jgi:Asp-tRNA(Asn)/Glu-tRNA(Gln) amidotransferase C subunit